MHPRHLGAAVQRNGVVHEQKPWQGCPSQPHGNQLLSDVAVRTLDSAQAASSSEVPVPTVTGNVAGDSRFARFKRSKEEAEMCDETSSVKTTRSLDTVSADTVRKLLEVVEMQSLQWCHNDISFHHPKPDPNVIVCAYQISIFSITKKFSPRPMCASAPMPSEWLFSS